MQFLATIFIKLDEYLEVCPLFALTDLLHLRNTYMHILFFCFNRHQSITLNRLLVRHRIHSI